MDLRRNHLDAILKQRLSHTRLINQNRSDTLLLLQEIERELLHELQKEEHQQLQYRHQTQLDLQLELLRIQVGKVRMKIDLVGGTSEKTSLFGD
jgi:hypothetical protein